VFGTQAERPAEQELELMPLATRELPGRTTRQRSENDRPESHAHETFDVETERFA
jgi:hypothetical protein